MNCRWSGFLSALSLVCATASFAQTQSGEPLAVIASFRGPFQHAVVGSSLVAADGTVLQSAGANLAMPSGAELVFARLLWMGSRAAPDNTVTLQRPDGTSSALTGSCIVAADVLELPGANYFQCAADVTAFLRAGTLSGRYTLSGAEFDTAGDTYGANPTSNFTANIYAGGFAVILVYRDPAHPEPRLLQVLTGLLAQHGGPQPVPVRTNIAVFDPLELSEHGGKLTHVSLEGDADLGGNERIDLCRDTCNLDLIPENTIGGDNLIASAGNPAGSIYNESITNAFSNTLSQVTETNGIDMDTFDLAGAYTAGSRQPNQFLTDSTRLQVASTTAGDMTAHVALVVELADFDADEDGLSNVEESERGTNPEDPDSDDDGIIDGIEARGGRPSDPLDPQNRITNPLDPDSDNDFLCDGNRTVRDVTDVIVCVAGEDTNGDGLHQNNEPDALDTDSDDDGSPDGIEVTGNWPGPIDADSSRAGSQTQVLLPDSDGDGLLDGEEDLNHNGEFDPEQNESDPTDADTDNGGEIDGSEREHGTDPTDPFDDEGADEDPDLDGCINRDESAAGSNPIDPDTDDDGIGDCIEIRGDNPTSPTSPDSDDDGLCDGAVAIENVCDAGEDLNQNGRQEPSESNPNDTDTDNDEISDGVEANSDYNGRSTDPTNPDSDDDGYPDGEEDIRHDGDLDEDESDPTDPGSVPGGLNIDLDQPAGNGPPEGKAPKGGCACATATPSDVAMWGVALLLVFAGGRRRARRS